MTTKAKTWRAWTSHELRRLEELRLDGMTAPAIAAELGRTLASVKVRLCEEGFVHVGVSQRWLRVLMRPHTIAGAAAEMGTSKWAVKQQKRKLRRAGFEVPAAMK